MSEYIVTARKWRPMKFESVAGQDHVTRTLRNAISSNRLAHAYLFSGPRGVGKTTTARLLAKAVNCSNLQDANPCGVCENCVGITEGRNFDVQEIDGASNRGIDEIRNLREAVRYPPTTCTYKVYIIDEVHMLTKEAFNALLKTLEEPPPHVLFIFATTELSKLLPTILSRCQRFEFRRIPHAQIMANLGAIAREEGLQVEDDALSLIARKGDGSLRDAQSLFDQVVALCGTQVTLAGMQEALNIVGVDVHFRITDLMQQQDAQSVLLLVDELMSSGVDLRDFLGGLLEHLRNLLIARVVGNTSLIEASDVTRKRYSETATTFSVSDLLRAQRLVHGTDQALRFTAQSRFRLEADMVQLVTMPRAVDLAGLIDGIEELKKGGVLPVAAPAVVPAPRPAPPATRPAQTPAAAPAPVASTPAAPAPSAGSRFASSAPLRPSSRAPQAPTEKASAPSPIPAGQGRTVSEDEVRSRWAEFAAEVSRRKISLGSVLGATTFLGVSNGTIRVECVDDFQISSIQHSREVLAEIIQSVFSARGTLQGELAAGHAAPPAKEEHPLVQSLKRELGAEPL
jgi:DNA polymerase III subunit gamma/tau